MNVSTSPTLLIAFASATRKVVALVVRDLRVAEGVHVYSADADLRRRHDVGIVRAPARRIVDGEGGDALRGGDLVHVALQPPVLLLLRELLAVVFRFRLGLARHDALAGFRGVVLDGEAAHGLAGGERKR